MNRCNKCDFRFARIGTLVIEDATIRWLALLIVILVAAIVVTLVRFSP